MVRREAFDSVSGFDERYWMYWEDADFCRRLKDGGWRIYYEPASVVHHATGASGVNPRTLRAFHESASRFADRYIARSDVQRRLIRGVLRARCRLALWAYGRAGRSA
jgi:N-acetylglucosaminyl-diphospho-decaprenol L-rhamnosyltransferase